MVERITYPHLPSISGPYVHATKHNETLYVSGLTALGTAAQSRGVIEQCQCLLEQIEEILAYESLRKEHIIKLTIFVKDIGQLSQIRGALFDFYQGYLPACSLVEVSNLIHPDLLVEIELIVALDDERGERND